MYLLVRHFGSLEKIIIQGQGLIMTPGHGTIFDIRGMIGRIYVELHMKLLQIKYTSFVSWGCREEDFFLVFPL